MAVATLTIGSTVEVSSDEIGFQGSWYVATLVDELQLSLTKNKTSKKKTRISKKKKITCYKVKYHTLFEDDTEDPLSEVVHPSFVRPLPPRNPRRTGDNEAVAVAEEGGGDFELHDVVDAYYRDGWWIGVVIEVIIEGEIKKYIVAFDDPPEKVKFERSQLRLHVDWIDRRWKLPPKKTTPTTSTGALTTNLDNLNIYRPVLFKRKLRSQLQKKAETNGKMTSDVEKSCGEKFQSTIGNAEVMVMETTPETECGKSWPKRKRKRLQKRSVKRSNGLVEGPSCGSSTSNHRDKPIDASNRAITNVELPFIKQSPIWASIESHELYQKPPQKPHFSPLKNEKECYREGLAVAHMVTFANVVQRISKLQWTDSNDIYENSLEALADLETHGFDVGGFQARLHELLSIKDSGGQIEKDLKETEKGIEERNLEKTVIEKEIDELEVKIQELQEKLTKNMMTKNVKDAEIVMLRTNLEEVSKRIKNHKLAFNILAASRL